MELAAKEIAFNSFACMDSQRSFTCFRVKQKYEHKVLDVFKEPYFYVHIFVCLYLAYLLLYACWILSLCCPKYVTSQYFFLRKYMLYIVDSSDFLLSFFLFLASGMPGLAGKLYFSFLQYLQGGRIITKCTWETGNLKDLSVGHNSGSAYIISIDIYTVNFLNSRTPKTFVVITLKFELCGSTIEQWVQTMQTEWQTM